MAHFKDISKIKDADVEELKRVDGMDSKAAEAVYNFFHGR